jgi:hypothetical protein
MLGGTLDGGKQPLYMRIHSDRHVSAKEKPGALSWNNVGEDQIM